ncbi:MAG: ABC transporter ATP-binding protein [Paracoccaceae bacterium]
MFTFFERAVDPFTAYPQRDAPPRALLPFMLDHLTPFRGLLWVTGVLAVVVAAFEIFQIWYLGRLIDLLSQTPRDQILSTFGWELAAVTLFVLLIRPVAYSLHIMAMNNGLMTNFGTLVRWRSHRHLLRQSVGWFEGDFAGRIANRVSQTPQAANEAVFQVFDALGFAAAYLLGAAVLLGGADPRLLIPLAGWFVLYAILMTWTLRRIGPASEAASQARSEFTGRIVDAYSNIHSVKMFDRDGRETAHAREAIEATRTTVAREMRVYSIMDMGLTWLNGLLIVAVVGWGIALYVQGAASVGIIAAASALTLRLSAMTGWIMWAVTSFFQQVGIVREGMETIAQPVTLRDADGAADLRVTEGAVAFEDVTHRYGEGAGGVGGVTLRVPGGQKVGLVGPSGAGKSTLVKLLLRFHDAEAGRIEIDGQDIAGVTQVSLRGAIGMVQQDASLMHRSVRDNLLLGRPDATEAQMIAAARAARAHEFIEGLRDAAGRRGYDAHVGERGVKLSGGQRQRVALARVILRAAPILVLDEATSALDSEVEAAIQETLAEVMEGRTVIAVAHRLSTIAHMDRIVVLEDGRVVEDGPHAALLARGGLYARLWERQSGGFLADAAQ